jgi:ankyrin repeat protein
MYRSSRFGGRHHEILDQLFQSVKDRDLSDVEYFFMSKPDISQDDVDEVLLGAIIGENDDVIDYLTSIGVVSQEQIDYWRSLVLETQEQNDPYAQLSRAVKTGDFITTNMLLDQGVPQDVIDKELLVAVNKHNINIVNTLLSHRANANIKVDGSPIINEAVINGDIEIVRLLLQYNADPTLEDIPGVPALYRAAEYGHYEIVKLLLPVSDVNVVIRATSWTPLRVATSKGYTYIVSTLLDNGADPDFQDLFEGTPLHSAARQHYLSIAELLLQHGANISIRDYEGLTARDIAANYGYNDIVNLIDSYQQ